MNRRNAIKLVGGGMILAAAPGCARPSGPPGAWNHPGETERDPRRRALAWAILAPNPHNMQPWLIDLRTPGEATLLIDHTRLLKDTDPFNRQIVIGCGAFLELARMAAARDGWAVEIIPFPDGEPQPVLDSRPVARLRFSPAAPARDPLFAAILDRHTNRQPFDDRAVPPEAAARIVEAASLPAVKAQAAVDPAKLAALKAIAWQGARVEAYTPAANAETADRTHFGDADVAAHPWGISLGGPLMTGLHAAGLATVKTMKTEGSFFFGEMLKSLRTSADTAHGWVWLTTASNSRAEQIEAGRAYVRAQLAATAQGLVMQPFSQCLQEYPAMAATYAAAQVALAPEGGRVQMFVRIGYANPAPAAPRQGLDAQILKV
jgi:hypothetical protein